MNIGENIFIQALQELNNHQIQHGECSITFTYHDGRVQFYTVSTSERHNASDFQKHKELPDAKSA